MRVIATAGHVDHGKSTLVRALTGMEPDRWAEERRRGMTIDLGYAWTTLDSGEQLAFVDVPGHHRFLTNMLAGVGPVPAVMVVVAADEGWRRQSAEHLAAINALDIKVGLLVVTRADLADPRPAMAAAVEKIGRSSLGKVEALAVSGLTGEGLPELRAALARTVTRLPQPELGGPVRLWVDRAFTITGSGTVVTATLGAGHIAVGDSLELAGQPVVVRALQSLGQDLERVEAVARVALNLRGVSRDEVARGDALLTPGAWHHSALVDAAIDSRPGSGRTDGPARLEGSERAARRWPTELMLHLGSTAISVRIRELGEDIVRLQLVRPLPLKPGDRAVLRDPGLHEVVGAATLIDVDPPPLNRRGAAAARAGELRPQRHEHPDNSARILTRELSRRGAVRRNDLIPLGIPVDDLTRVKVIGDWLISPDHWQRWHTELPLIVEQYLSSHPMAPGMPEPELRQTLEAPAQSVLIALLDESRFVLSAGRVSAPGRQVGLGAAEPGMQLLEQRLATSPFTAPERGELAEWGLGQRELTTAARTGRVLRLPSDIILLPSAPTRAAEILSELDQPFSTSAARQALRTTRRVVVPLLEYLDELGLTERLDGSSRQVIPASATEPATLD